MAASTADLDLFSSLTIGPNDFKNRIVMAPLTRGRAAHTNLMPNDLMAEYYAQRAGAGLIITEGTFTSEMARGWVGVPSIQNDADAVGWKKVTDSVHAAGGLIFCQLWHTGRASHSSFRPNLPAEEAQPVAASAVPITAMEIHDANGKRVAGEVPRALDTSEVEALPAEFKNAAEKAKAAGFDGVEVHSANGYLINTFLDDSTNKRTDKYGGSNENKFRVLKEILESVLEVWPSSQVGVRMSPNGVYNHMGFESFRESYLDYAKRLVPYELGYLHVMDGLRFGFHGIGEPMKLSEIRAVYPGVIMSNCGKTKESGTEDIKSGNSDLVSYGAPFIANPDLPARFKANAELAEPKDGDKHFYGGQGEGYTDYATLS